MIITLFCHSTNLLNIETLNLSGTHTHTHRAQSIEFLYCSPSFHLRKQKGKTYKKIPLRQELHSYYNVKFCMIF